MRRVLCILLPKISSFEEAKAHFGEFVEDVKPSDTSPQQWEPKVGMWARRRGYTREKHDENIGQIIAVEPNGSRFTAIDLEGDAREWVVSWCTPWTPQPGEQVEGESAWGVTIAGTISHSEHTRDHEECIDTGNPYDGRPYVMKSTLRPAASTTEQITVTKPKPAGAQGLSVSIRASLGKGTPEGATDELVGGQRSLRGKRGNNVFIDPPVAFGVDLKSPVVIGNSWDQLDIHSRCSGDKWAAGFMGGVQPCPGCPKCRSNLGANNE